MKKTLQLALSAILIFSLLWPSSIGASDATIGSEIVNLRQGPGLSYPVIDQLEKGDTLTVLEASGEWLYVEAEGTKGWVASWLTTSAAQLPAGKAAGVVISQADHLNIRSEPSLSAAVLGQLFKGNEAQYIKADGEWIQIKHGQMTGWVSAKYVTLSNQQPEKIEKATSSLTGSTFTINVDAVNIRKKADLNSKKIGVAYRGERFKVVSQSTNWVQIETKDGSVAWIYSFYGSFSGQDASKKASSTSQNETVTIIYNGTNLRSEASTSSSVIQRAQAGESYPITGTAGDWYQLSIDGQEAYVANWLVTINNPTKKTQAAAKKISTERKKGSLKGLTIVVDPGHGGNDHGTTGVRGTEEKEITLKTAELLSSKLQAAGAEVIMTRQSDLYVDLRKRVSTAHQAQADAFISIHYDATTDSSVTGLTTYYTNSYQKELAQYVHAGASKQVEIRDRGVQLGNYLVLRENRHPSILIELGFLSNPNEERTITTNYYREQATLGIYNGILQYFDAQL